MISNCDRLKGSLAGASNMANIVATAPNGSRTSSTKLYLFPRQADEHAQGDHSPIADVSNGILRAVIKVLDPGNRSSVRIPAMTNG